MKKQRLSISKISFLLAVMGSTVGLGGIWGFPTQMYNHHGAFLIPFLICMVLCAIPVLFIEMIIGNKYRKNHIEFFSEVAGKKGAFFAWLHSATVIMLSTYYSVIVAWTLINIGISFTNNLNTDGFFYDHILQATGSEEPTSFANFGNINIIVLVTTLGVWGLLAVILLGGVEKGIDKANKIFIPFLFVMIIILVIYTSTLKGASLGLNVMFNLNGKDLLKPEVWRDAFGQAFFMLSTCTGTIYIYAAHAPKRQDSTNQAFVVALGTSLIGILTAIIIFNAMGAIAYDQSKDIKAIFREGPALVFQVIPQIFKIINSQIPIFGNILAVLFFFTLFSAGMSSLIGQVESLVNGLEYQIHFSRKKSLLLALLISVLGSIMFTFNKSPALFTALGMWVAQMWLLILGLILLVLISPYGLNLFQSLRSYNNDNSWIQWNRFYKVIILIIAPLLIAINVINGLYEFVVKAIASPFAYGTFSVVFGIIFVLVLTTILTFHQQIGNFSHKYWKFLTKKERG